MITIRIPSFRNDVKINGTMFLFIGIMYLNRTTNGHPIISMGVALRFPDVAIAPLVDHSIGGMTNRYSHTNSAFQIHAENIISTRICELMNGDASLIGKELVREPNAQGI